MKRQNILFGIICLTIIFVRCSSERQLPFRVKECSYQTWFIDAEKHGTRIWIKVKRPDPGVEFDSVVFRGFQMPVVLSEHKNYLLLRADIPSRKMMHLHSIHITEKSDQLQYRYMGQKGNVLLTNIERKEMTYY